jgi:hypothetical protein
MKFTQLVARLLVIRLYMYQNFNFKRHKHNYIIRISPYQLLLISYIILIKLKLIPTYKIILDSIIFGENMKIKHEK